MALSPVVRIPRFEQRNPFVDEKGRLSTEAHRRLNDAFQTIERTISAIAGVLGIQDELAQALAQVQDLVDQIQQGADDTAREQALVNSYILPSSVLTATAATQFCTD